MKKNFKYLLFIFLILVGINKVDALTVSKNDLTIEKGKNETIELYANVEEKVTKIDFTLVYTTYDVPAYFTVNSEYRDTNPDGIKHSIILPEPDSGKILLGTININVKNNATVTNGSINIHTASATTEEYENVKLNIQNINVKIGTAPTTQEEDEEDTEEPTTTKEESDKNLLAKIESKIVKIDLKKDVFEYTITVDKDIEELDLKPIAKDETAKIDITSQKIKELDKKEIIITVKKDKIEQKYTIKITKEEERKKPVIDEEKFQTNNNHKTKWIIVTVIFTIVFVIGLGLSNKK